MATPTTEKIQNISELLRQTLDNVTASPESWRSFLLSSGVKFYKYQFADQLLIHAQRPEATACASYQIWNRLERYVRRGACGIALLE